MGSGTGMQFGKMIVRADGKEIIDGKEYIKKVEEYSGLPGRDTRITYYRSSAEGIYKINGKQKEMHEYVSTPFPLEVGTKWIVREPEGEFHFSVVAKETVELTNMKYRDCLIVSFTAVIDSSQIVGVSYLAPNIGVVKNTLKYPNGAMEFLLEKYTK
jgi:hypothetical protein